MQTRYIQKQAAWFPTVLMVTAVAALLLTAKPAKATPFFARTYHFPCQACHDGFPRLNTFGQEFKANGFRMPGAENKSPLAWQKTIPIAVQIEPTHEQFEPGSSRANFTDTQLLAGGLLTQRTSFYMHHSLFIDDKTQSFPTYELWVQQVVDDKQKVMVKAGQFELPYAYSPVINRTTVFEPLLFTGGIFGNDVVLGSAMTGIQIAAGDPRNVRGYLVAGAPAFLATGNQVGDRQFFGRFRDLFMRVATGPAGKTAGIFALFAHPPRDPADPSSHQTSRRIGLDGLYNWRTVQLSGAAVYGQDNNPTGSGQAGILRSAFLEADDLLMPRLGITARLGVQTVSMGGKTAYSDARLISLRGYPYPHLRLSAEYVSQDHGAHEIGLLADIAF